MRVCGVICEYNPFHRGHAHHLSRAREASGAEYVVCVMSGPITQRGVFARHDKWLRAEAALKNGADLVIELSCRFACSPAPEFAAGGVSLLDALGVVTHLSFGCEGDALPHLQTAAAVLREESSRFKSLLQEGLSRGLSYPRARAEAAEAVSGSPGLAGIIASPNAALALEYLAALPETMSPVPILREGGGYHDAGLCALSSATAVRAALVRGDQAAALAAVPCPDALQAAEAAGRVHEEEALTTALLYRLRTMTAGELRQIRGMDEGLENRLLRAAQTARNRRDLLDALKTKRYTHARLSRLLTDVLLGVTRDFAKANSTPAYARVLGFKKTAVPLLSAIKKQGRVPLVTKAADFDRTQPLFQLDLRAQDLWALGCTNLQPCGLDFTTSPIRL